MSLYSKISTLFSLLYLSSIILEYIDDNQNIMLYPVHDFQPEKPFDLSGSDPTILDCLTKKYLQYEPQILNQNLEREITVISKNFQQINQHEKEVTLFGFKVSRRGTNEISKTVIHNPRIFNQDSDVQPSITQQNQYIKGLIQNVFYFQRELAVLYQPNSESGRMQSVIRFFEVKYKGSILLDHYFEFEVPEKSKVLLMDRVEDLLVYCLQEDSVMFRVSRLRMKNGQGMSSQMMVPQAEYYQNLALKMLNYGSNMTVMIISLVVQGGEVSVSGNASQLLQEYGENSYSVYNNKLLFSFNANILLPYIDSFRQERFKTSKIIYTFQNVAISIILNRYLILYDFKQIMEHAHIIYDLESHFDPYDNIIQYEYLELTNSLVILAQDYLTSKLYSISLEDLYSGSQLYGQIYYLHVDFPRTVKQFSVFEKEEEQEYKTHLVFLLEGGQIQTYQVELKKSFSLDDDYTKIFASLMYLVGILVYCNFYKSKQIFYAQVSDFLII